MVNPQLENGYTKIANEILETLAKIKMSGQEWQVIVTLLRKTYGWNKKEAWISLSTFAEDTATNIPRACEAIKALEARKIITKKRKGKRILIGFNKDYKQWKSLRKNVTLGKLRKNVKIVTQKRNKTLRKSVMKYECTKEKKENIKENISNKLDTKQVSFGNKEINLLLEYLKQTIGIDDFKESQQWQRRYANHIVSLIKKIGKEETNYRLQAILDDEDKNKWCNKIEFIYRELKAFKKVPEREKIII